MIVADVIVTAVTVAAVTGRDFFLIDFFCR